jgi:hypothetical protein
MFLVRNFFLFPNQAFAQLDLSYFATSFLTFSLNLMVGSPGFLRAGRTLIVLFAGKQMAQDAQLSRFPV